MTPEWERAAREGEAAVLRALLEQGADVDALDRHGQTAVMLAAVRGHLAAVEALVSAGAKLDVTAKYRLSAAMLAAVNGHEAVVRVLAAAGADLALTGSGAPGFAGRTAADLARDRGLVELADELARLGRG